ncbi:DUF4239 domain-containing protein [Sphingomonas sp. G124]|uniref:DUF4239 domain-containing protein n=1 Tax=Sphingomonas cremea TaxID=2904799 RepID=A0A9X1U5Y2_9SPHN|nr:DUF4239 domain-containing protein [Sphingomonas cremea]MCF2515621.1 DUF4239 domain-containing protein [Sphingomonas cremea]
MPIWLSTLLVLGLSVAIGIGSSVGLQLLFRLKPTDEEKEVAINLMQVVAAYIGIMLAFAGVVVWQDFADAQVAVHQEASTTAELYRDLSTYGPETLAARQDLRSYVESVIKDEWPLLREGKSSAATEYALGEVFEEFGRIGPHDNRSSAIYQESFSKLNDLVVFRRNRIIASQTSIPLIFWLVGLVGSTLTIAYASAFSRTRYNLMMISGTAITLGLVFLFILTVNKPFKGNLSEPSSDFLELTSNFDQLDRQILRDEGN